MRWIVSNLEQFRRAASIISTFLIVASIGGWAISVVTLDNHSLATVGAVLYLASAVIVKVAIRHGQSISVRTVFLIETVIFIGLLFAGLVEVYFLSRDGFQGIGTIRLVFNVLVLVIVAIIFQRNTSAARSMASRT